MGKKLYERGGKEHKMGLDTIIKILTNVVTFEAVEFWGAPKKRKKQR